jgi:hypothetical protein
MINVMTQEEEWVSLKEASSLTGKSMTALRVMIKRGKGIRAKKIQDNNREYWFIHRDELKELRSASHFSGDDHDEYDHDEPRAVPHSGEVMSMMYDMLERQRKEMTRERDQILQGLMMYRYKYEELDRQVKALPAPPDEMSAEIKQKDFVIREKELVIESLSGKLSSLPAPPDEIASALKEKEMMIREKERMLEELSRKIEALPSPPETIGEELMKKEVLLMEKELMLEEMDRKIKLLPASPEEVAETLEKKESLLGEKELLLGEKKLQLEQKDMELEEKERLIRELRSTLEAEQRRPWWKKMLGM